MFVVLNAEIPLFMVKVLSESSKCGISLNFGLFQLLSLKKNYLARILKFRFHAGSRFY